MKKTFKLLLAGCLLTAGFAFANGDNYVKETSNMVTDTVPPQDQSDVEPVTDAPAQDTVSVPQDTQETPTPAPETTE